jgi:hypothetical protein
MKYAALFAIAALPVFGQITPPASVVSAPVTTSSVNPVRPVGPGRIALSTLSTLERRLDGQLSAIGTTIDPLDLLGTTRGVYLDGYGIVFTTECSLIITPSISPFRQSITEQDKIQVHQRKVNRLPVLKKTMREMMKVVALSLAQVPDNQLFVLVVRLDYLPYEDTTGLPGQIIMSADRRSALAGNIKTEEQ